MLKTRRGGRAVVVATLLIGALGLSLLWFSRSPDDRGAGGTTPPSSAGTAARLGAPGSNLPVTVSSCTRSGDSLWTEGLVRNGGQVTVRYVEIELAWDDASRSLVDTRVVFAVGGEVFTPGDSSFFRGATGEAQATDCSASLFSYEPL